MRAWRPGPNGGGSGGSGGGSGGGISGGGSGGSGSGGSGGSGSAGSGSGSGGGSGGSGSGGGISGGDSSAVPSRRTGRPAGRQVASSGSAQAPAAAQAPATTPVSGQVPVPVAGPAQVPALATSQTAAGSAVLDPPVAEPQAGLAGGRAFAASDWVGLTEALPSAVALLFAFWGITVPSYWRDEAATIAAVSRPLSGLTAMLGHVDAVHGAYYLLIWPLARMFGTSELVLRLPSAIAMAIAAAAVAGTGRKLISPRAGLAAGLLFAVLPMVSQYGQTARSYALAVAAASVASWLLTGLLGDWRRSSSRRAAIFAAYAFCLTVLGALNIFGLLLIPAHGVTVALAWRRQRTAPGSGLVAAGWLIAAGTAVAVLSPLLLLGWGQRGQVAWLARTTLGADLRALVGLPGPMLVSAIVVAVICVAAVLGIRAWPGPLTELALPWLVLPPAGLLAVSLTHPVFTARYVLICLPALALLGGAGLAGLGRLGGAGALALIAVAGLPAQVGQRGPAGHGENIRAMEQIVGAQARRGDVVLYPNPNADVIGAAYPSGLASLPDIAVRQGPIASGTLAGAFVSLPAIRERLAHADRIWVVEISKLNVAPVLQSPSGSVVGPILTGLPFSEVRAWRCGTDWLLLFAKAAPSHRAADRHPGREGARPSGTGAR